MSFASVRSINEVICHGIPDQRKLKEGDIINLGEFVDFDVVKSDQDTDISVYYQGGLLTIFLG